VKGLNTENFKFYFLCVCSAVLASRVLKEKLNLLGKVGCALCVIGSTVMVIHSPKEQEVSNIDQLKNMVAQPGW
jgi:hypothetical protein